MKVLRAALCLAALAWGVAGAQTFNPLAPYGTISDTSPQLCVQGGNNFVCASGLLVSGSIASYVYTTNGSPANLAYLQPSTLIGNPTANYAQAVPITLGAGLAFSGNTLTATGGGSGTVTSASVVSANGFAGTVATPTTTPAITLSTSITGPLKGLSGALAAASASDIYNLFSGTPSSTCYLSGSGACSAPAGTSTGTVTSVSVVTANGYSGTVATATTTPAITISGPAIPASANPSASVGPTPVNGTATTFMTSDSAPPLNEGANYTLTGGWTFNGSIAGTALSTYAQLGAAQTFTAQQTFSAASGNTIPIVNSNGTGSQAYFSFQEAGTAKWLMGMNSTPYTWFLYDEVGGRNTIVANLNGNLQLIPAGLGLVEEGGGLTSIGTTFTVSGCGTIATKSGGADAGIFVCAAGASPATLVITLAGAQGATAPNGWHCEGSDETSGLVLPQTAHSTTTCTLKGNIATSDQVSFSARAY